MGALSQYRGTVIAKAASTACSLAMTLSMLMKSLSLPCREMVVRKVKRESLELMEEMYVNNYLM